MHTPEKDHHHQQTINIDDFEGLLQKASELRGHRCLGLPLGIKMAQMGLKLLNMTEDEKKEYLVVFVENANCPADAIQIATGCSAGSGKFKMMYLGQSAATFVDGRTEKGYRVVSKKDLTSRALELAVKDNIIKAGEKVEGHSKLERDVLMNAFMKMAPEDLLDAQEVKIIWTSPLLPSQMDHKKRCGCAHSEELVDGKGPYYELL